MGSELDSLVRLQAEVGVAASELEQHWIAALRSLDHAADAEEDQELLQRLVDFHLKRIHESNTLLTTLARHLHQGTLESGTLAALAVWS